ncbi:hypothetical protein Trco_004999 [Trichoderma cornu-damae]|uniref:Autophagy-related protein 1 n=1 Tax=Trichoderma cornu-damae TaxID=654480 RepID=A0A9P8QGP8_9HYPO|nr:hypothetical protein Trco_004999 [Trichoderma cornu-damae]
MEWMPHDLHSVFLEDDKIPLLLSQVNSALVFMHANGFTRRDLKPENILTQHNAQGFLAKVADVGLSKYSSHGRMQTFAGSIAYTAPEIWDLDPDYTNVGANNASLQLDALDARLQSSLASDGNSVHSE